MRLHRHPPSNDPRSYRSARAAQPSVSKTGLVLVGGGARGAYQAGVLQGLAEIIGERPGGQPLFDVVTGISAGAINAAYLASRADRMVEATSGLAALWSDVQIDWVMRTDALSLFSIGTRWLRDITLGGVLRPNTWSNHLLDTTPLRELLTAHIEFDAIARHIASDILHGFAVSATSYATGEAVTFFDGHESVEPWTRSSRLGWRTRIRLDHVLASASIPIVFRPVFVEEAFYGDRRHPDDDAARPSDPSRSRQNRRHLRAPSAQPRIHHACEPHGGRSR